MTQSYSPDELERRIAIVGMACRVAGANSVDQFWANVKAGEVSLTSLSEDDLRAAEVPKKLIENPAYVRAGMFIDDPRGFDAGFFGFSPRDARLLDPQHRHLLEICWEALEDGGYDPFAYSGSIGVFAGSGHNAYMPYNLMSNPELVEDVGFFLMRHTGNDKDFLATRVSYLFNLRGPSLAIQTACSTSLVCVHTAAQSLLSGECDMALAGGVTISLPLNNGYLFEEGGIASNDGSCRAFDADSTGTVLGDGGGIVLLKRLEDAIEDNDRIHGVIVGSAVNNDGSTKVNYLAPSVDGQAAAVSEAIEVAGISPDSVGFIECHGTGTKIGDPIEIAALTQAYGRENDRKGYCAIGSVKTNIGHTDTGAGVMGLIKAIMSVKTATIAPTAHYRSPNPEINFAESPFFVSDALSDWNSDGIRRASVNSLGVGGTNAHVIIEEPPAPKVRTAKPWNILALSAKSATALNATQERLKTHLENSPDANLSDCEFTLLRGRQPMRHRKFAVVRDMPDALNVLRNPTSDRWSDLVAPENNGSIVFMYAGGGAQHPNMGKDLYESQPVFRDAMNECASILSRHVDFDLLKLIYPEPEQVEAHAREMERPSRTMPTLFSMQYAQTMLWQSMGVKPDALIGHSMGENMALCIAGGITLEEGLSLVAKRGKLQEAAPEGGLLSVFASPEKIQPFLTEGLSIGVFNGPELCVVTGPLDPLASLQERLERAGIDNHRVRFNVAAHSHLLDPVLPEFKAHLENFDYQSPTIPIASTASGRWLTDEQATDPNYWVDHLRNPVRFDEAIRLLLESDPNRRFVEVGPGQVVGSFVRQQTSARDRAVISSSRHHNSDVNDEAFMLSAMAQLWAWDGTVDWAQYFERHPAGRTTLPTYPFEHAEHWVEAGTDLVGENSATDTRKPQEQWLYQPVWQAAPAPNLEPDQHSDANIVVIGDKVAARHIVAALEQYKSQVAFHDQSESPDQLKQLLQSTAENSPNGLVVVHADALKPIACDTSGLDASFFSLWRTVSILSELELEHLRLSIVTDRALQTFPGEPVPGAVASTMLGMARVLPNETQSTSIRFIDTDLGNTVSQTVATTTAQMIAIDILENAAAEFRDAAWTKADKYPRTKVLSYRSGQRYEQAFTPVSQIALPPVEAEQFAGRHVVVSGGLGGLGLDAAQFLAEQGCSHITLLGRSDLPPRSDWSSYRCNDTRIGRRVDAIEALEQTGVGVSIIKVDITDAPSLQEAYETAKANGGPIAGVLHAAGTLDDQLFQLKTAEGARDVLHPKVIGAVNLINTFKGEPLEFVVFYSSVSAYLGAPGQTDYAAANAFLDSYARDLTSQGVPAVSINWPIWQNIGMAADLVAGRKSTGSSGFADFEPRLRDQSYETCLSTAKWILNEHRTTQGLAIVPGTALIQLVYSAFEARHSAATPACVAIKDMSLFAPISVSDGDKVVGVVRFATNGDDGQFDILTAQSPSAAVEEDWAGEHVQGRITIKDVERPAAIDIDAIQRRLTPQPEISKAGLVSPFLDFGDRWACLKNYWSANDEMFAELALPERYVDELSTYPLHPALMDNAIAGLQSVRHHRDNPNEFLIPMSYGEIVVHSPLTSRVFSHVVSTNDECEADQRAFNIWVCDPEGNVLVEVQRFRMKVGVAQSLDATTPAKQAINVDLDFSGGISADEGRKVLQRAIGNPIYPQILVSPLDFNAVMRSAHRMKQPTLAGEADDDASELSTDYAAPETETQNKLSEIWKKGLGLSRVGIHDNFFELGGHSLLLTQLVSRMKKELNVAPKTSLLFGSPTIAGWAELADSASASPASQASDIPIKRISRDAFRRARN